MFQAPVSDANGRLESFSQVTDTPDTEPPFLVNGVRRPRLVLRRGEVQNWHFINAGIFRYLNLSLDGHVLNVYSFDGNPRAALKLDRTDSPGDTSLPEGVVLAPANRASVLVQGGAPGTYYPALARIPDGFRRAAARRGHRRRSGRRRRIAADGVAGGAAAGARDARAHHR